METSDDVGSIVSSVFGGGGDDSVDLPRQKAENVRRTAEPVEQVSEKARKKRRLRGSVLTEGFAPAKLSQPGLLGIGQR